MSRISDYTVNRLTGVLPLADRQAALPPKLQQLHRAFLRSLVDRGRPMTRAEIAAIAPGGDATAAIWMLAANDLIVLDAHGNPVGAYPITTQETPHKIQMGATAIWAMCAFDAAAVAPAFDQHVVVTSRCPITGEEIVVEQRGTTILSAHPSGDIQVGVWWRDPGACAARNFCPGVVFLADRPAALKWQAGDPKNREFAGIADAIEAGAAFFRPLVGPPIVVGAR
jgi:mercuric reductase